jgi:hypothetical protein
MVFQGAWAAFLFHEVLQVGTSRLTQLFHRGYTVLLLDGEELAETRQGTTATSATTHAPPLGLRVQSWTRPRRRRRADKTGMACTRLADPRSLSPEHRCVRSARVVVYDVVTTLPETLETLPSALRSAAPGRRRRTRGDEELRDEVDHAIRR